MGLMVVEPPTPLPSLRADLPLTGGRLKDGEALLLSYSLSL